MKFRNENDVEVEITPESACEGSPLFGIKINGYITWEELEALAWRLHPAGLSAQQHTTAVRDASPWIRGGLECIDDGDEVEAEVALGMFPLVVDGMGLDDGCYVACPACGAQPGVPCDTDDYRSHRERFKKQRAELRAEVRGE